MKTTIPALMLLLCACNIMPPSTAPSSTPASNAITPSVTPGTGTLYARDGTVVTAGSQTARADQEPKRDMGPQEGSRVYLLELYQKSMADKTALAIEVDGLHAALDEERRVATTTATEQERLKSELAQMTQERDSLRTQALDLAARVTSAQIARLEAEKALLQLKIDGQREDTGTARRGSSSSRESQREPKSNGGKNP